MNHQATKHRLGTRNPHVATDSGLSARLHSVNVGVIPERFFILLSAILVVTGCSHHLRKVEPWVWPGANRFNTLFFAQAGTRPKPALRYVQAWEAEWFEAPELDPVPVLAHATHQPLVVDLNHDGEPEIITSELSFPPHVILNADGVPLAGRTRNGTDWGRIESDSARIVADDSAGWVMLPKLALAPGQSRSSPLAVRLNQRVVALQIVLESRVPFPRRVLECWDCATGRRDWRYEFGARPDLMAVADLDSDGKDELLLATYGEENGAVGNGTQDHDSCYCVALRDDGTLLWQRGFGAHPFSGCLAGVADLNRDGKPEVFVGYYTWQNDFGGLAVLDGATGRVIAASPGPDSVPVSHVSVGCADVDGDGRLELATAVSGRKAEVLLYRLEGNRLAPVARTVLSRTTDPAVTCECRLHAICDLDGDGKCELVVSRCRKRLICPDPMFYPSKSDSCGLSVLGASLENRQDIPLPVRCQYVTLGDVVPGGNIEMLVVTDRLTLYSTEAN